ncbi:MAG: hypothetical protein RB294_06485 [Bacteroidales bacterium]|jgi:hypothetical protein|nr:hypothetical protein [Bacteroidales bacterium]
MKKIIRFFKNWDRRTLLLAGGGALVVILVVLLIVLKPFSSGKIYQANDVIPDNAFAVLRINNPGEIIHNSIYKNTLSHISFMPAAEAFVYGLMQADTVLSVSESSKNLLSESQLYISFHPVGKNKTQCLFVLQMPEKTNAKLLYEELNNSGKVVFSEKSIDGNICYTIGKKSFNLFPCNNLLIGSLSTQLLEQSIAASEKKSGISNNEEFVSAQKTASSDCEINIFVNTPMLYRSLGQLVSGNTYVNLAFLQTVSSWGNLDVKLQDDVMVFSGLFPLSKANASFMSLFDEPANGATQDVLSMLPANTAAAFSFGFGHFEKFFSAYAKRLSEDKQNAYNNDEELAHLNQQAKTESIEKCFYQHISGQLCVFSTSTTAGREPQVYCAFPVSDGEEVKDCLLDYAADGEWDTAQFRNATLICIPVEYGAFSLFGPLFEPISETCIAVTEHFVFIGNSPEHVKPVLNDVLSGRTLGTSEYKQNLTNHIASSWNIFSFLNTSASSYNLENRWLSDTSLIASLNDSHKNKQAGIISMTAARQSDGIVVSGTWFFGKSDSSSSSSWATTLDANISGRPVILKDFKTGEFWIAVADVYDNVYLLNSDGVIVWKKEVGDAVNDDFQLLWSGNKEKRSMAFSTSDGIYIIGLDGEIRSSFPVSVRAGVASNLLVADYDNNQKYRLIFGDSKGVLNNYTTDGKSTEGWLKPDLKNQHQSAVFFSPLGGSDYIVVASPGGTVQVFDRKGKSVVDIDEIQDNKGFCPLQGGRDVKFWTAFSSDGALISVNHHGDINPLTEKSYGENVLFEASKNQVLAISAGMLYVFNAEGRETSTIKISESAVDYINVISVEDNHYLIFHNSDNMIGVVSQESGFKDFLYKSEASAFACIAVNDKIRMITSNEKTVVFEIIAAEKD